MDSHLVIHLSVLLSLCLIEGSVPDGFCQNVITPVLKGRNLDPTLSNNYRPITVSSSIKICWNYTLLMNAKPQFLSMP